MSTDEIRSLVAATRAVAKAERERDEARAALEQVKHLAATWTALLADGRCPSCHLPFGDACGHVEGCRHALSDLAVSLKVKS